MDEKSPARGWVGAFIVLGAGFFVVALLVSAIFDPTIRVLHVLQALIYVTAVLLARRGSPWGFGVGFTTGVFWNYTNLFVTTFIAAGLRQLEQLVTTGRLSRPDLLVAVIAAGGHVLLIVGCAVGFMRLRPRAADWAKFVAGGTLSIAYFAAIIVTTGPQYIPLLKRVFGIGG